MIPRECKWLAELNFPIAEVSGHPVRRFTGAIHVYGGDFFNEPRSEWDPESLVECPYNVEKNLRLFEEANTRLAG